MSFSRSKYLKKILKVTTRGFTLFLELKKISKIKNRDHNFQYYTSQEMLKWDQSNLEFPIVGCRFGDHFHSDDLNFLITI